MHRGTNVPLKKMKIHILKLCRNGVRCTPNSTRYWPQRVRSVTPHTFPTCINPCKSGDGSCLKKIDLPTQGGGGRSGNFRGSKNQNSGKCHELSRKSIKQIFFTHPTPGGSGGGGSWGSKFQKSGKFHELSRKSIKKSPAPTKGGRSGNFRGSKNQKSGKCHELPRKVINKN